MKKLSCLCLESSLKLWISGMILNTLAWEHHKIEASSLMHSYMPPAGRGGEGVKAYVTKPGPELATEVTPFSGVPEEFVTVTTPVCTTVGSE